ncbi:MAG: hypothetical protein V1797_07435, partial [Pseudomonadota bacterium]
MWVTENAPIISAVFSLLSATVVVIFSYQSNKKIELSKSINSILNTKLTKLQQTLEKISIPIDLTDNSMTTFQKFQRRFFNTRDHFELITHFVKHRDKEKVINISSSINRVYVEQENARLAGRQPERVHAGELQDKMHEYH